MQKIVMFGQGFLDSVVQFAGDQAIPGPGDDRPLVFLQIPQAAQRGFTHFLKEHFRDRVASVPPFPPELSQHDGKYRRRQLYRGHFQYARWQRPATDAWLLSFLRDPVQRVVAQYHVHHRPSASQLISAGTTGDAWRLLKFAQRASLEEYVLCEDPYLVSHLRDVQTRAFSSFASPEHPRFLASALENLERGFLFFGIADFHETSLHLFRAQFGSSRPYCSYTHRRHRHPPKAGELTDRTLERIHQLNPHDVRLHEHAVSVFQLRCERLLGQRPELKRRAASAA